MLQTPIDIFSRPVSWVPLEGPQYVALKVRVNVLLLAGGRGWGKTETQLQRFVKRVQAGYGSYWRGIIFDREYKNLDDLVVKSKRLYYPVFGKSARFLESKSDYKWVWDTGEELLFRQAKTEADYWSYHGHEYPYIGWNELTKYPTGKLFHMMLSINRSGFDPENNTPVWTQSEIDLLIKNGANWIPELGSYKTRDGKILPPIPLEVCATTNPYGAGHNWVKSEFIDPAPYGKIHRKTFEIFNPKTQQEETITRTQAVVFGTFKNNKYLSPEYIAGLMEETDENILDAWLKGDWDIVAGGALDDKWKKAVHVIPRFKVPKEWYVDRSLDWGSSHPYSVGYWAEANGEEVILPDGSTFCPPRGTLIQIGEIYGAKKIGSNTGTKEGAKDVARAILAYEKKLLADGWVSNKIWPGPADNQISNVTESTTDTIEKMMQDVGVNWTKSDKSAGSRKNGLQLIRDRLEASIKKVGPGLLFMDNCRASIATIPVLPRDDKDPDDIDTDAEDHAYDMARYRVLAGNNRMATVIKVNFTR